MLSGTGKNTSGKALGMFLEMPPVKVRHQKLQARWLSRIVKKDNGHAVHFGLKRARTRTNPRSAFFALVDERNCPKSLLLRWFALSRPAVGSFFQPRTRTTSGPADMVAEWYEEEL